MKRHLFLTGPIGCGKSTVLMASLGEKRNQAGGFLTVRRRYENGKPAYFMLMTPDGREKEIFLDLTGPEPRLNLNVFDRLGVDILRRSENSPFLVLDEIGGIELLCPEFMAELDKILDSDIPIIGVVKGAGPVGSLVETLGLSREYEEASHRLRTQLREDPRTTLYESSHYDKTALALAKHWVKEYAHE